MVTSAISLGGGISSTAMTIMVVEQGWRGPIVFADTGGEKPATYEYLDYFEGQYLRPRGLTIVRLVPGDEYHGKMSQVSLEEYCLREGRIPLMSTRWCTGRWKARPLDRWARDQGVDFQLLGISADESWRTRGKPKRLHFPLVEARVTREGCRRIILEAGLFEPLWSACFFCPGQTYGKWRYIHDQYPDLWERARQLEKNASERRGKVVNLSSHMSLDALVARGWEGQLGLDFVSAAAGVNITDALFNKSER